MQSTRVGAGVQGLVAWMPLGPVLSLRLQSPDACAAVAGLLSCQVHSAGAGAVCSCAARVAAANDWAVVVCAHERKDP